MRCFCTPIGTHGLGTLYGYDRNEETGQRERFVVAEPEDLDPGFQYAEERRIQLIHIQPGRPMQNGRIESFNGRLRDECRGIPYRPARFID